LSEEAESHAYEGQMIKMPNYWRTSSFWISLYLRIWAANRLNLTKFGMQTQILTQPRKHDKH